MLNFATLKYIFLIAILWGGTLSMANTTRKILQSSRRLQEGENEIARLEKEKEKLETQIEYKKTPEYIEEIARNKLNMAKPGEEIYMYPTEKNETKDKSGKQQRRYQQNKKNKVETKGYLQDWWNLIRYGHR